MAKCLDCGEQDQRGPRSMDGPEPSDGRCRPCRRKAWVKVQEDMKLPHSGGEHPIGRSQS